MSTIHQQLSTQYHLWELRGRGWFTYPEPVALEPPFQAFSGYRINEGGVTDDARRPSITGKLWSRLGGVITPKARSEPTDAEELDDTPVTGWTRATCIELPITFPKAKRYRRENMESFLRMCRTCHEPVSFEVLADAKEIGFQWACSPSDAVHLKAQSGTHFPGQILREETEGLSSCWQETGGHYAVAEIGLARDFLLSIETGHGDLMSGLIGAMSGFAEREMGLFQVMFEPVGHPWGDAMIAATTKRDGSPIFNDRSDLVREAAVKARSPMYAVVVRLVTCAESSDRAWALLSPMVVALNVLARPNGNHLVPLAMQDYDAEDQEEDILRRQSHRWGMLLSQEELLSLVRFPGDEVVSTKLRQDTGRTRSAVSFPANGLFLGWNDHAGTRAPVRLTPAQRVRHMHVIGGTGTGKTTFLFNLIQQDMESGNGFALLDPHGDLVDRILDYVPPDRQKEVVLIDAGDEEYSVGFNVLSAKADYEKTLLASDLVGVFQRLSTSWGDQMGVVFRNAILAFLERPEGGTLADVQRFLLEPDFRSNVLETVTDPDVVYYWRVGFPKLGGTKSIGPVLTRLQTFLSPKPIRYMVSQRDSKLDIGAMMDSGKILLVKLPLGLMGAENSYLLGSLIVSKIQQAAMARQRMPEEQRRFFALYVDEFQNFITPSMAEILSGTRKYQLSLVLAHQDLEQLGRNDAVGSAVRSNAGTRVVFRVGDADARELAKGFTHFEAEELQSLSTGQAIMRVERGDNDFNLSVPFPSAPEDGDSKARRDEIIARSRRQYARARTDVEGDDRQRLAELSRTSAAKRKEAKASPEPPQVAPPESPSPRLAEPEPPAAPPEQPPVVQSTEEQAPEPSTPKYETTQLRADLEELGRGGEIHKAAQAELKVVAESKGFRATIERQLPGSLDTVDLYVERDGVAIACEVTVTNTLEYELRNITKCLRAGVPLIAVIALDESKRSRLAAAIENSLSSAEQSRVKCLMKDDFEALLDTVHPSSAKSKLSQQPPTKERVVKGWKVRTNATPPDNQDVGAVEQELAATLGDNLRRRRSKPKDSE